MMTYICRVIALKLSIHARLSIIIFPTERKIFLALSSGLISHINHIDIVNKIKDENIIHQTHHSSTMLELLAL